MLGAPNQKVRLCAVPITKMTKTRALVALMLISGVLLACSDAAETGSLGGGAASSMSGASGAATVAGNGGAGSASAAAGAAGSAVSAGTNSGGGGATGYGGTSYAGTGGGGNGGSGGAAVPTDGPGLYGFHCAVCHGEQGRGSMLAPDIMHPMRDYSTWVVRNGRAVTSFAKPMEKKTTAELSDAQLSLIFDYLDTPPQPTTGAALYADYCANCHGANGKGGPTTRDITNEVDEVETQVRKGAHPGEYEMRKEFMPVFSTTRISDSELTLIRDYVESL
jgi:mono/diheme cytochrome c family protein